MATSLRVSQGADDARECIATALDEPRTRQRGYFRPDFLSKLTQLNQAYPAYYGEVMWVLLVLELWQRHHFDGQPMRAFDCGAVHAS